MKKILTILTVLALVVLSASAQGYINFNNSLTSKIFTNSAVGGSSTGVIGTTPNSYNFALFASSQTSLGGSTSAIVGDSNPLDYVWNYNGWDCIGTTVNSSTMSGRLASTSVLVNQPAGTAQQFIIVGWSANLGSSLNDVEAWLNGSFNTDTTGWIGQSAVSGAITLGNGVNYPIQNVMGNVAPQIGSFTLGMVEVQPVPEPSTMALAGLGGLAILVMRQRRK